MPINSAEELLLEEVRQIYNAEKQLQRAIPRFSKRVQHPRLREAFDHRREESQHLVEDLDHVLEQMGKGRGRAKNEAVEGLIDLGNRLQDDIQDPQLLDAAMLGHVQKLEHYCIAAWGTVAAMARTLDEPELVRAMEHALDEGKRFDDELTELAENEVNRAALAEEMNEEDEEEDEDIEASGREEEEQPRRGGRSGGGQAARGGSSARSGGGSGARSGGGQQQPAQAQRRSSGGPGQRGGQGNGGRRSGGNGGGQRQ